MYNIIDPENPNPISKKNNAELMRINTSNLEVASKSNARKKAALTAAQEARRPVTSYSKYLQILHTHTLDSLFDPSTRMSPSLDQLRSPVEQTKWLERNSRIELGPRVPRRSSTQAHAVKRFPSQSNVLLKGILLSRTLTWVTVNGGVRKEPCTTLYR